MEGKRDIGKLAIPLEKDERFIKEESFEWSNGGKIMINYVARTLGALAAVSLFACSDPVAPNTPMEPKPSFSELKNNDCEVKRLHDSLYETILNYDGQQGLHVISPMTVEARTARMKGVAGFVGHDRVNGLYFRQDESMTPMYFSESYMPNGDEMACDLAERLLVVAQSQK